MMARKPKIPAAEARRMRAAARLYAVQALFQMEASGAALEAVLAEFETHRFGAVIDGGHSPRPISSFSASSWTARSGTGQIDQMTDRAWSRNGRSRGSTRPCARCSAPPARNSS